VIVSDAQVRKLMEELSRGRSMGTAADKAGMDRKTARKYRDARKLPSQLKKSRDWRTRPDPFVEDWSRIVEMLTAAPELEAKTIFDMLVMKMVDGEPRYHPGQLRTLQRRVRRWRATEGPPKVVFFPQEHRPGEAAQTDFTWATKLQITIGGMPFDHMLCHVVLPYSNWEWATVCHSESLLALRAGVQAAVFELGRVPRFHQTDNSTAATHDLRTGLRGFNEDYLALMRHLGMKPRTTGIGEKEQNGDVESLNGALKRRLKQHLLIRGNRDFDTVGAYETWLRDVLHQANGLRVQKVREEQAVMRPLQVKRLPEYKEVDAPVRKWSTIRVEHNAYSVPSRLIGETVRVRVWEDRLEIFYAGQLLLTVDRLLGRFKYRIDYRHIIWSLVRKPGAFALYKYREELFPSVIFRRAYDALQEAQPGRGGDIEYLCILHLAASTMESEVETALVLLLENGDVPLRDLVKELVVSESPAVPDVEVPQVDLGTYDALLHETGEASA